MEQLTLAVLKFQCLSWLDKRRIFSSLNDQEKRILKAEISYFNRLKKSRITFREILHALESNDIANRSEMTGVGESDNNRVNLNAQLEKLQKEISIYYYSDISNILDGLSPALAALALKSMNSMHLERYQNERREVLVLSESLPVKLQIACCKSFIDALGRKNDTTDLRKSTLEVVNG